MLGNITMRGVDRLEFRFFSIVLSLKLFLLGIAKGRKIWIGIWKGSSQDNTHSLSLELLGYWNYQKGHCQRVRIGK